MSFDLLESGIAELSRLIGVLGAFLLWRINASSSLLAELRTLGRERERGHLTTGGRRRLLGLRVEGAALLSSVLLYFFILALAADYFALVHRLLNTGEGLDYSVASLLVSHAREVHARSEQAIFVSLVLVIFGWVLHLATQSEESLESARVHSHPLIIPPEWRHAAAGLWQARLGTSARAYLEVDEARGELLDGIAESGSWRHSWTDWAFGVSSYWSVVLERQERSWQEMRTGGVTEYSKTRNN